MREFVVVGHEATTDPDFPLDDLPGAGRLDVLCRCVADCFLLSHGIREDVRLHLVMGDELAIRFEGSELRYLSPDERNVASLIRSALETKAEAIGMMEAESTPGVYVSKRGFEDVLDDLSGGVIRLHPAGEPIGEIARPAEIAFVLSDHRNLTDEEARTLDTYADTKVSLGPERLHADQAITVVHNALDTDGYTEY